MPRWLRNALAAALLVGLYLAMVWWFPTS